VCDFKVFGEKHKLYVAWKAMFRLYFFSPAQGVSSVLEKLENEVGALGVSIREIAAIVADFGAIFPLVLR
jgi:hypothetical protein